MDEKTFNALMVKGSDQTLQGDSYPIEDVFTYDALSSEVN